MNSKQCRLAGFSLIELVVVVVIIAIIGAIAIPKMSRGAAGANDSAVIQDLATMRGAVDLFVTEHGGIAASNTPATFIDQMTGYTDASGNYSAVKDTTHIYGPYLKSFPNLPVGTYKGSNTLTCTGPAGTTAGFGWYFDGTTIWVNDPAGDIDASGVAYNTY